jgi:hypothetical protein
MNRFAQHLSSRVEPGSPVLLVDNRYVERSNWRGGRIHALLGPHFQEPTFSPRVPSLCLMPES